VGIAFYFGEGFASLVLPDIVKYLPFSVANASLATGTSTVGMFSGGSSTLPADQAQVLVIVWLVGALVVAALFSDRAEIAG
jgi:beta-lactamase regulating signal transducer with metallopeptidase domain